jgi:hypothetical protein
VLCGADDFSLFVPNGMASALVALTWVAVCWSGMVLLCLAWWYAVAFIGKQ